MQQKSPVDCKDYSKISDDSWKTVNVTDIKVPFGIVRIPPGTVFRKGGKLAGIDVASLLEEFCCQ